MENKLTAEFFGTFWLVFGGCGSAVLSAIFLTNGASPTQFGIGFVGVSLAFGLTVLTTVYAISLGVTLIHLIGIPVTKLSVNPARSIGPAVFVEDWALAQLWLFEIAPFVGLVYPAIAKETKS